MTDFAKPLDDLYWRDEILQLMYWMAGEGFGQEFSIAELQKFLPAADEVLVRNLELMGALGLVECFGESYKLTSNGQKEGGRRFADEFEQLLKPGHFECDEPDCDCHAESFEGVCKHLTPAV